MNDKNKKKNRQFYITPFVIQKMQTCLNLSCCHNNAKTKIHITSLFFSLFKITLNYIENMSFVFFFFYNFFRSRRVKIVYKKQSPLAYIYERVFFTTPNPIGGGVTYEQYIYNSFEPEPFYTIRHMGLYTRRDECSSQRTKKILLMVKLDPKVKSVTAHYPQRVYNIHPLSNRFRPCCGFLSSEKNIYISFTLHSRSYAQQNFFFFLTVSYE